MNVAKAAQYHATTMFWLGFGFFPVPDDSLASCVTCFKSVRHFERTCLLERICLLVRICLLRIPSSAVGIIRLAMNIDMFECEKFR